MKLPNQTKLEQAFFSDITYLNWKGGPLYLTLVTVAYSKKIMGYDVLGNFENRKYIEDTKKAMGNRSFPKRKLIHHSDRGFQYRGKENVAELENCGIGISMTTNMTLIKMQ